MTESERHPSERRLLEAGGPESPDWAAALEEFAQEQLIPAVISRVAALTGRSSRYHFPDGSRVRPGGLREQGGDAADFIQEYIAGALERLVTGGTPPASYDPEVAPLAVFLVGLVRPKFSDFLRKSKPRERPMDPLVLERCDDRADADPERSRSFRLLLCDSMDPAARPSQCGGMQLCTSLEWAVDPGPALQRSIREQALLNDSEAGWVEILDRHIADEAELRQEAAELEERASLARLARTREAAQAKARRKRIQMSWMPLSTSSIQQLTGWARGNVYQLRLRYRSALSAGRFVAAIQFADGAKEPLVDDHLLHLQEQLAELAGGCRQED